MTMLATVVLALLATQPAPDLAGVLSLDRALGESVKRNGLLAGLAPVLSNDVGFLYAGAPVVVGRARVLMLLEAQSGLAALTLHWAPSGGWLSTAGDFAAVYGTTTVTEPGAAGKSRPGTYISCWRLADGAWRLAALQVSPVLPPAATALPAGVTWSDLPDMEPGGADADMIAADRAFAALAGRTGAPAAFAVYGSAEAVLNGGGNVRRGPAEIRAALAAGPDSDWRWAPVHAGASAAGDLGFTIGQSVITPKGGGEPSYGKYLTVWRRESGGLIRFLTDAGNARPH